MGPGFGMGSGPPKRAPPQHVGSPSHPGRAVTLCPGLTGRSEGVVADNAPVPRRQVPYSTEHVVCGGQMLNNSTGLLTKRLEQVRGRHSSCAGDELWRQL